MNFLLASTNQHKAHELTKLGEIAGLTIASAKDKIEVVEDGATFQENAFKKAMTYFKTYNAPVVSDDSGLVVQSLPEELGIYSARFGGEGLNDRDRAMLLLEKLQDFPRPAERQAYFVCHLCFILSEKEVYFFEGRLNGKIGEVYRGSHGFGYDPIFIPEGQSQTLAELPEFKQQHSHRAVAMRYATSFFKERNGQKA
jgi:XTP/dITP diphosphohydrolase